MGALHDFTCFHGFEAGEFAGLKYVALRGLGTFAPN